MMKRLPIRLKLAVLYVNMTIFTIPNLVITYLFIKRLNDLPAGAGTSIVTGFRWGYVIFLLVYLAVTIFLGRKVAKTIAYPIRDLDKAAAALSQGDNNIVLDYEAGDEIGELFSDFRKMAAGIQEQAAVLDSISHGDYTVSIAPRSENDVINHSIMSILEKNNSMFSEIQGASAQVSSASTQIADGAQALSQGASEQAGAVENLSASIGRVLTQTAANTRDTNSALEVVSDSSRQMELTLASMEQMQQAMGGISSSSEEIAKIIKVIDDIAFQTNILALNAAVEAARAGQHGRGFAVVADEVRNLASKSAEAAKETAALIQKSLSHVGRGEEIVTQTSKSIETVAGQARKIQEIIAQINSASQRQQDAIDKINDGIEQVSQVVQQNSATAEQSAASSEEMSAQAMMLNKIVSHFRLKSTTAQGSIPHAALPAASAEEEYFEADSEYRLPVGSSKYF